MIWRKGRFYGNFLTPRFFPRSFLRRSHAKKKPGWIQGTFCVKWDDPEGGPETHDVSRTGLTGDFL